MSLSDQPPLVPQAKTKVGRSLFALMMSSRIERQEGLLLLLDETNLLTWIYEEDVSMVPGPISTPDGRRPLLLAATEYESQSK